MPLAEWCPRPAPCASKPLLRVKALLLTAGMCPERILLALYMAQQGVALLRLHASGGVVSRTGPVRKERCCGACLNIRDVACFAQSAAGSGVVAAARLWRSCVKNRPRAQAGAHAARAGVFLRGAGGPGTPLPDRQAGRPAHLSHWRGAPRPHLRPAHRCPCYLSFRLFTAVQRRCWRLI